MKPLRVQVHFPSIIYFTLSARVTLEHTAAVGGWDTSDVARDRFFLLSGFASMQLTRRS